MKVFITGGAGFIGCNCALHFMNQGYEVIVFDNLSRIGSKQNLQWLSSLGQFQFLKADIRDFHVLKTYFQSNPDIDVIVHLAAQTAVTTSVDNPREDFEINALGTLNLLEAVRKSDCDPIFLYSSTNKVYGNLNHLNVKLNGNRYQLVNYPEGIPENAPLDFHSPYGCSKGAADQYVRDFHRIYGIKTVIFRQSCIYGPRQYGVEDQGWVAWFIISALTDRPLNIFGNGCQVRDILEISDLIRAFTKAIEKIEIAKGSIYNIGGGKENCLSLLQLIDMMEGRFKLKVKYSFSGWRKGDQKVYISDISKSYNELGWHPNISIEEGIQNLYEWSAKTFVEK